ncbi:sensor histidine kinase [Herbaspirillum sp. RV1423]|uniref:sensor histidine kinase n=1 Tax=Herbaspirillum sp. RV1423 TaxID=1443993 RepID=UPI00054EC0FD|nr:ATP-binding protein [Herbaspirillum sp. RV1423]
MSEPERSSLLQFMAGVLALVIFLIDALTPLDIAIAVLYVAVVLVAVTAWPRRGALLIMAGCMLLTVAAYVISYGMSIVGGSFARMLVSLVAIAITTFLALKGQAATSRLLLREEALSRAQAQLTHVTRVTMLGELAASIAHEVNQPLAAINANGEACLRWIDRPQPEIQEVKAAVQGMLEDATRASEVIRRVRLLSRKSEPAYAPLAVNDIVEESAALVQRELARHGVRLTPRLTGGLPLVHADRVQLQQVIINLMMNGMQAMEDIPGHRRELVLETSLSGDDRVAVTVIDCGHGIDPAHRDRLFDPFFSTKTEGMGMGLPICRSIIESHGGRIRVIDGVDNGAALQFSLPSL